MSREIVQFDDIFFNFSKFSGQIRLAVSGIGWKSNKDESKPFTFAASNLLNACWYIGNRGFNLSFQITHGSPLIFENFANEDLRILDDYLQNFNIKLETFERSVSGWNWGDLELNDSQLCFRSNKKPLFEVPLANVANINLPGKHELSMEIDVRQIEEIELAKFDELCEIRFYVADEESEASKEESKAQSLYESLKSSIETREPVGEAVVVFTEVFLNTPRGRYDIELYMDFMRLRGKTYDYKIAFGSIKQLFLLPKSDDLHIFFIVGLDPPLRQGQTRYYYLVMQFARDEEMEVELNITDTDYEQYKDRLDKKYDAAAFKVISQIFRGLVDIKITMPGSFVNSTNQASIKCSYKASEGQLFILEKSIFFVPKPSIFIPLSDLSYVALQRFGTGVSTNKTFDLKFKLFNGNEYQFSSVYKEEQPSIEAYFRTKSIKVRDETKQLETNLQDILDDNDDDEPDQVHASDRGSAQDNSESPDEDFEEDESDSEVAEEFDEEAASDSSDSESRQTKKPRL